MYERRRELIPLLRCSATCKEVDFYIPSSRTLFASSHERSDSSACPGFIKAHR